jgi:hypothetical protein
MSKYMDKLSKEETEQDRKDKRRVRATIRMRQPELVDDGIAPKVYISDDSSSHEGSNSELYSEIDEDLVIQPHSRNDTTNQTSYLGSPTSKNRRNAKSVMAYYDTEKEKLKAMQM